MRTALFLASAAALSACSGTAPYSSTYNSADYDYAAEAASHLRGTIAFADRATAAEKDPAVRRAAAAWARRAHIEIRAIDGLIGAVRDPLSPAQSAEHRREHPPAAFPTATDDARGEKVLERLISANEAAIEQAEAYQKRGRQPSLKSISSWLVEDRKAESAALRNLLEDR